MDVCSFLTIIRKNYSFLLGVDEASKIGISDRESSLYINEEQVKIIFLERYSIGDSDIISVEDSISVDYLNNRIIFAPEDQLQWDEDCHWWFSSSRDCRMMEVLFNISKEICVYDLRHLYTLDNNQIDFFNIILIVWIMATDLSYSFDAITDNIINSLVLFNSFFAEKMKIKGCLSGYELLYEKFNNRWNALLNNTHKTKLLYSDDNIFLLRFLFSSFKDQLSDIMVK